MNKMTDSLPWWDKNGAGRTYFVLQFLALDLTGRLQEQWVVRWSCASFNRRNICLNYQNGSLLLILLWVVIRIYCGVSRIDYLIHLFVTLGWDKRETAILTHSHLFNQVWGVNYNWMWAHQFSVAHYRWFL